jgi:hypothetical protein
MFRAFLAGVLAFGAVEMSHAFAADELKVELLAEKAPPEVADALSLGLAPSGYRVLDASGKPLVDLWFRETVPGLIKPAGPMGAVLFPFLTEGEWLGVARYHQEGGDYRDQSIEPGVYTLRYLLHPVNGDHLGVSPYRDFLLLVPAAKDTTPAALKRTDLEKLSAEASGSNHPCVLNLKAAPANVPGPKMVNDAEKELWGLIAPLKILVGNEADFPAYPIQLILQGHAPT